MLSPVTKKTPVLFGKISEQSARTPFSAEKKRQNAYPRILMTNISLASAST
jgi:hypothetical protein